MIGQALMEALRAALAAEAGWYRAMFDRAPRVTDAGARFIIYYADTLKTAAAAPAIP